MERIQFLINRLQELYNQDADYAQLKMAAQHLLAEIQQKELRARMPSSTGKVAVVMPSVNAVQEVAAIPAGPMPVSAPSVQQDTREINDAMAAPLASLNDALRESKTELADALSSTPIPDLRKAISLNDRFIYIRDLFEENEAHFDLALKTLNHFNQYAEAEFWVEKELKSKKAWLQHPDTAKAFMQLVRRRFL